MQNMLRAQRGLGLIVKLNFDLMLSVFTIFCALLAASWMAGLGL